MEEVTAQYKNEGHLTHSLPYFIRAFYSTLGPCLQSFASTTASLLLPYLPFLRLPFLPYLQ